jgi:hypothetical protein
LWPLTDPLIFSQCSTKRFTSGIHFSEESPSVIAKGTFSELEASTNLSIAFL